jgi:hypothetical protein
MSEAAVAGPVRLLQGLALRRFASAARNAPVALALGLAIPALAAVAVLLGSGSGAAPDLASGDGVILLGLLVSAPTALLAYPVLFRPADDGFLRHLAIHPGALFTLRALRLGAYAAGLLLALLLPYLAAGQSVAKPLAIGLAAAALAWASALWSHARAAGRTGPGTRLTLAGASLGPDLELARAAALVFAPLWPLLAGATGAVWMAAPVVPLTLRAAVVIGLSAILFGLARRGFAAALPRFAPYAADLAWAPPLSAAGGEFAVGVGVWRVLPARVQAVRARDALLLGRRYRWSMRLAWPVAGIGGLALLRGGAHPGVRSWVALAAGALLLAQAGAVLALGRSERGRTRWLDRSLGLGDPVRLGGRGLATLGMGSLVVLPLVAAWWIGVPQPAGWSWLPALAAGALLAAGAANLAAGR